MSANTDFAAFALRVSSGVLFVAHGLLLDTIAPTVAAAGWSLVDPLGPLLAPVVAERYRAALGPADPLR
jgi:hypothetical protein